MAGLTVAYTNIGEKGGEKTIHIIKYRLERIRPRMVFRLTVFYADSRA